MAILPESREEKIMKNRSIKLLTFVAMAG